MADTSSKRAKPALVRAWFDTVLNPLIQGLRTEHEFLARGDLTWRTEGQRFAALAPVREHIVPDAWPNLEQFLSVYGSLRELLERHDSALDALHVPTAKLHETLKAHPKLLQILDSSDSAEGLRAAQGVASYFAEYVVNSVRSLPDYYAMAMLWNKFSSNFLALRDDQELQPLCDAVDVARRDLLCAVDTLLKELSRLRDELSFEMDVPIFQRIAS